VFAYPFTISTAEKTSMSAEMDYFVGDAEPTVFASSIKVVDQMSLCSNWAKIQMGY